MRRLFEWALSKCSVPQTFRLGPGHGSDRMGAGYGFRSPRTCFSQRLRRGSATPLCPDEPLAWTRWGWTRCKSRPRVKVGMCLWMSWVPTSAACPESPRRHTRIRACAYLQVSRSTEAFPGNKAEPKWRRAPTQGEGSAGTTGITRPAVKLLKYFTPRVNSFSPKLLEQLPLPPQCTRPRAPSLPRRPTIKG